MYLQIEEAGNMHRCEMIRSEASKEVKRNVVTTTRSSSNCELLHYPLPEELKRNDNRITLLTKSSNINKERNIFAHFMETISTWISNTIIRNNLVARMNYRIFPAIYWPFMTRNAEQKYRGSTCNRGRLNRESALQMCMYCNCHWNFSQLFCKYFEVWSRQKIKHDLWTSELWMLPWRVRASIHTGEGFDSWNWGWKIGGGVNL